MSEQFPSYLRPFTRWVKEEIEKALQQRGISTRSVAGASVRGESNVIARVGVRKNSADPTYQRRRLNLIEGAGVTITTADDSTDEEVDVTLASVGFANPMDSDGDLIRGGASGAATKLDAGTLGQVLAMRGATPIPTWEDQYVTILVPFDNGATAIAANSKREFGVDFAGTFVSWKILGQTAAGAIKFDLWKCAYADYDIATHPVNGDSICGGHEPEIAASAVKAEDTNLTDWTSDDFTAGDCFIINVDACTTLVRATLCLKARRG